MTTYETRYSNKKNLKSGISLQLFGDNFSLNYYFAYSIRFFLNEFIAMFFYVKKFFWNFNRCYSKIFNKLNHYAAYLIDTCCAWIAMPYVKWHSLSLSPLLPPLPPTPYLHLPVFTESSTTWRDVIEKWSCIFFGLKLLYSISK